VHTHLYDQPDYFLADIISWRQANDKREAFPTQFKMSLRGAAGDEAIPKNRE
jgi:hypothetical protein